MKQLKLSVYLCLLIHAELSFAQTCNPNIIADAPDSRYTANTNGTVVDKKTGLTWMRCALGQAWRNNSCIGSVNGYKWQDALQTAESTMFAGLNDWRLPNIKELQSLVENRCYEPAINLTAFPNATSDWFWSSSPNAISGSNAWTVDFDAGDDWGGLLMGDSAVRLVRGGY